MIMNLIQEYDKQNQNKEYLREKIYQNYLFRENKIIIIQEINLLEVLIDKKIYQNSHIKSANLIREIRIYIKNQQTYQITKNYLKVQNLFKRARKKFRVIIFLVLRKKKKVFIQTFFNALEKNQRICKKLRTRFKIDLKVFLSRFNRKRS